MKTKNNTLRNIPIMYLTTVIGGMLFFLPVLALYFEESLFTVTNVAIIFAIESFAAVVFEIPTGAIADLFGRKKTTILAYIVMLIGLSFLYIGGSMLMFALYAILNACAMSLASGTDDAMIYDTLKENKQESRYKKTIGTYHALWPLGASIGAIIGGYLGSISLSLPVLVTFIPISIATILLLFIKEPDYEKEDHKNIPKHMWTSVKSIVHNRQLIILLVAGFLMIGLGETIHLLSPIYFDFKQIPIEYFGYITALTFGFSSLGFYLSHDISERFGNKFILVLVSVLSPIFIFISTLLTGIPLVIMYTVPSIFFGLKNPILSHFVNLEATSSKRATIISINNFSGRLGLAIIAPFLGYFAEIYSITTAIQLTSVLVLSVPVILLLLKDR